MASSNLSPVLAEIERARGEGRFADAIAMVIGQLAHEPTRGELWTVLRALPLFEHPEAAGIAAWMPMTHARVPAIVHGLLAETAQSFHAGKLLVAADLARLYNVPLPFGQVAETAGIPVLVRPIMIPPQDIDPSRVLRIDHHPFQPWVHTHNRPDRHRKSQHPFVPFVRIPGLQVERAPADAKGEHAFLFFDAEHGLIAQDTMWVGHPPSPKILTPISHTSALVFGWTPDRHFGGPVIVIPNRLNYYHFLHESLPAAALAVRTPALSGCLLLFSRLSDWQHEALRMADVSEDRILELSNVIPGETETGHARFSDAWLPVDLPVALACTIVRTILPAERTVRRGLRLIVARGGGQAVQRLVNEDEVIRALTPLGFETVRAETLSFARQLELFSAAEIVIGAHGAGLTNMLHAPQTATLIELMNSACHTEQVMNFSSMQRITQSCGQYYLRVVGDVLPGTPADVFPPNQPYAVSVEDVLRAVATAEQWSSRYA